MNLTQQEWASKVATDHEAIILDVRTEEEWNEGIIPGAILNDIYKGQAFIYKLEEMDKNKNFYIYCKAGARSAQACSIMNTMGFENTFNLEGGLMHWEGKIVAP
jgi:rhodanese-related sulfurtransferase